MDAKKAKELSDWLRWKRLTEYQPRRELWREGLTSADGRVRVVFDWSCKRPKSDVVD